MFTKGDTVGYLKRVGDCSALFSASAASMFLLRKFMGYNFKDKADGIIDKIKYFFSDEMNGNYDFYLALIILLILSFIISTIFHKFPYIPFAFSTLPLIQTIIITTPERIFNDSRPSYNNKEFAMFYLAVAIIHTVGCFYECIRRDREDIGRRSAISADLLALIIFGFCALTLHFTRDVSAIDTKDITAFEKAIRDAFITEKPLMWAFEYGAIVFPVLVAVRLLHQDIYYIDAILSLVPFVGAIVYWVGGEHTLFGGVIVCLCTLYAFTRLAITLSCKARIKQKKAKISEE